MSRPLVSIGLGKPSPDPRPFPHLTCATVLLDTHVALLHTTQPAAVPSCPSLALPHSPSSAMDSSTTGPLSWEAPRTHAMASPSETRATLPPSSISPSSPSAHARSASIAGIAASSYSTANHHQPPPSPSQPTLTRYHTQHQPCARSAHTHTSLPTQNRDNTRQCILRLHMRSVTDHSDKQHKQHGKPPSSVFLYAVIYDG